MEIEITQEVIDTVCNSLRASKQSLVNQMVKANENGKSTTIIASQLTDVQKALDIFRTLES